MFFPDKKCYNLEYTAIGGEDDDIQRKSLRTKDATTNNAGAACGVARGCLYDGGHYEATKLIRRRFDDLGKKHGITFDDAEQKG